tara:strand:+ start:229 stop:2283 length:2055 start_codon:yes stop_codon:yes gene_type:complete
MKKLLQSLFILTFTFASIAQAQITKTSIGSSWNMYTVLSPSTNPVHANNSLGTISYTHRQNSEFPGGSGIIQTTWSEDGGLSWDNYALQPTNDSTQFNRYPSGLILDPTGNNDMANAQTVVTGPTTSSAASGWVGNYFYNFTLDGSGGREFNLLNTDAEFSSFTRNSMMADKNNFVRVLGYEDNGLILTTGEYDAVGQSYYTDFAYASTASYYIGETVDANGVVTTPAAWGPVESLNLGDTIFYMTSENYDLFSDGSIDSTWTNEVEIINYFDDNGDSLLLSDTILVWSNVANIQDAEGNWISTTFDYDSFYVELNGAVDSTLIQGTPGYYWTQQGLTSNGLVEFYDYSMAFNENGNIGYVVHQGTDASGQIVPFVHYSSDGGTTWTQLDHDFSVIEAYILPAYNGGIDCTVDVNGDLHMISCLFEADESVTETNRKLYDIVVNPADWNAHWIADINTERVLDTDPMAIHGIGYNHRIQAARSSDGSRVFAIWTDVNLEEFGEVEKIEFPDIYAFGKDVGTGMVTGVTNFTKYTMVEGACYWMFSSPVTYDTNDTYTLPTTISEAGNDELSAMEHFYIDGISFDKEDFIIENWNMDVTQIPSIEVDVYPNPASDFANLSLNMESAGDVSISLLNAIGQEVFYSKDTYKSGVNSVKIDINGLESGVYLYTVESENFATTKRLVVK